MKHILRKIILSAAIVVMAFVSATAGINDLPVKTINGKKYYYYEEIGRASCRERVCA